MMRTHLEFRSSSFPALASEEVEINPGRFGRRLADYLMSALPAYGLQVEGSFAEDWGWRINLKNEAFPLWIGCGNYEEYPDSFLCFVEPSQPYMRRGFRRVPTTQVVEQAATALELALANHDGVTALRWWDEAETRRG